jgi:hypothetical protein
MRPVRIAVLGEENSGKSLLLNYLLKHQILPSNRVSGEETEILVRYSREPSVYVANKDGNRNRLTSKAFGVLARPEVRSKPKSSNIIYQSSTSNGPGASHGNGAPNTPFLGRRASKPPSKLIEVGLPLEFLKHIELIEVRDLPEEKSTAPAAIAFRRVDMTVWCTLATQAWKETEAISWRRIPLVHRQYALMLVTYKDAIQDPRDEAKILERLRRATPTMFDDILLVSLKDAVASLVSGENENTAALRSGSNIDAVEFALVELVQRLQTRRLRKASRVLRSIAAVVARAESPNRYAEKRRREIAVKLDRIAQSFMDASPSVSLTVEAA